MKNKLILIPLFALLTIFTFVAAKSVLARNEEQKAMMEHSDAAPVVITINADGSAMLRGQITQSMQKAPLRELCCRGLIQENSHSG